MAKTYSEKVSYTDTYTEVLISRWKGDTRQFPQKWNTGFKCCSSAKWLCRNTVNVIRVLARMRKSCDITHHSQSEMYFLLKEL